MVMERAAVLAYNVEVFANVYLVLRFPGIGTVPLLIS
jgi:hypothetical protein